MADLKLESALARGGMSRLFGVIPAAGGGARFGAHLPKQYLPLGGRPLLVHVLERLQMRTSARVDRRRARSRR